MSTSLTHEAGLAARRILRCYRDDGPLAAAAAAMLGRAADGRPHPVGRLAWLLPPLLRLGEYGLVLALAARSEPAALPLLYALLAVLAFHHYDLVYRLRGHGPTPPVWLSWLGGGWDGRSLVLLAAAAGGRLPEAAALLAVWCAALFVGESVTAWRRQRTTLGEVTV